MWPNGVAFLRPTPDPVQVFAGVLLPQIGHHTDVFLSQPICNRNLASFASSGPEFNSFKLFAKRASRNGFCTFKYRKELHNSELPIHNWLKCLLQQLFCLYHRY